MAMNARTDPRRRGLLALGLALPWLATAGRAAAQAQPALEVWKDPNCGCCKDWVAHLEANGFQVKVHDTGNNAVRARLGIDKRYGSCHTAVVGGYAIEGHVPAADIHRLLRERPKALGLAVPGMPVGSPGMDGDAYGGRKDPFKVLLLGRDGTAAVYSSHEGNKDGRKA